MNGGGLFEMEVSASARAEDNTGNIDTVSRADVCRSCPFAFSIPLEGADGVDQEPALPRRQTNSVTRTSSLISLYPEPN